MLTRWIIAMNILMTIYPLIIIEIAFTAAKITNPVILPINLIERDIIRVLADSSVSLNIMNLVKQTTLTVESTKNLVCSFRIKKGPASFAEPYLHLRQLQLVCFLLFLLF